MASDEARRVHPRFAAPSSFATAATYSVGQFRHCRIPGIEKTLVTNEAGEYLFLGDVEFNDFVAGRLSPARQEYLDLAAKQMLIEGAADTATRILAAKVRTKKSFLKFGPALHLFVVTLRCDHSCHYCQVSRVTADRTKFDMSWDTAAAAVDRLFESNAPALTVEFQGGEPLLAFPVIEAAVEAIKKRNDTEKRQITFTITTTLHHLSEPILEFFRMHGFQISTSLDGPAPIHDANRPCGGSDSHARTVAGIQTARAAVGYDTVSALTTLTRRSLEAPEAIVDEYVRCGFKTIFLRPLSPYGFAAKSERKIGYDMPAFLRFYERALAYILDLNSAGVEIDEAYGRIVLSHILTPYPSGYVDLRSPTGAGFSTMVYNYDGSVYPSDEARMLAAMGDETFRLGNIHQPVAELMGSPAMALIRQAGIAEELPGCADCAFVPYCGADPVHMHATLGDVSSPPTSSPHCAKHTGIFRIFFRHLAESDPAVMQTFMRWIFGRPEYRGQGASV